MGLTTQQEQAARSKSSVSVTAGAGTGKTHMLTERFIYHVSEENLSPMEIVAVTFTEKAAAELRSRIRQKMHSVCPDDENALAELEAAQISTIHALAARICRDHSEMVGLSPDFSILDESEGSIWRIAHFDQALAELPLENFKELPFSFLKPALLSLLDDPISAEKSFNFTRESLSELLEVERTENLQSLLKSKIWIDAKSLCSLFRGIDGDAMEANRQTVLAAIEGVESSATAEEMQWHLESIKGIGFRGGSAKKWENGGFADVKESLQKLKKFVEKEIEYLTIKMTEADEEMFAKTSCLKQAFLSVKENLSEQKKREKVLSFADLEEYALKILQKDGACAYYQKRWKAFLIDEFQDTNAVQAEILSLLTDSCRQTIVGDEKQSIYGFRRSDVMVFHKFTNEIRTGGGNVTLLSESFRTHEKLISQFNKVFVKVLSDSHQELTAFRKKPPHTEPYIDLYAVSTDEKINKSPRERVESRHIAQKVKEMLDEEMLVHDKQTDALRPLRPGDIAVLSRAWDALDNFAEAFAGVGIPAVNFGGGNLLETREVKDAMAMLRFLADQSDEIALATVLRSPFFAVSDKILFEFSRKLSTKQGWWSKLQDDPGELLPARDILQILLNETNTETPVRLLQLANRLTGYLAVITNLPQGRRREADWNAFIEFIEQQEKRGIGDLFGLIHHLSLLIDAEAEIPRTPLDPGNAVSLLTIHSAKGLEWSVVIVPDLSRQIPNDSQTIYFEPDVGVAFKVVNNKGEEAEPSFYKILKKRKKIKNLDEAKRVLYVALTRARDRVILSSTHAKGGGLDILQPGLTNAGIDCADIPFTHEQSIMPMPKEPAHFPVPTKIQIAPVKFGLLEIPVTALSDYAACPERFRFKYIDGHPGLWNSTSESRRIGYLTHKAIEKDISDLQQLRRYDFRLNKQHIEESLLLADQWRSAECYEEYRNKIVAHEFQIKLQIKGVLIRGIVDLLGDNFALDFKTDQEIEPEAHRFQLWAYAKATEKNQAHIAYLRHGEIHTFDQLQLNEIESDAIKAIENIRDGIFEPDPAESKCSFCGFVTVCRAKI